MSYTQRGSAGSGAPAHLLLAQEPLPQPLLPPQLPPARAQKTVLCATRSAAPGTRFAWPPSARLDAALVAVVVAIIRSLCKGGCHHRMHAERGGMRDEDEARHERQAEAEIPRGVKDGG